MCHPLLRRASLAVVAVSLSPLTALAFGDNVPPTIGTVSPASATVGVSTVFSASASDAAGIASCNLYVDNDDVGAMTVSGTTASKSYAFGQAGVHTVFVFCRDGSGSFNSGASTAVVVTSSSGDKTAPAVGAVSPLAAGVNVPVLLSATATDAGGVASCALYVDNVNKGAMTVSGGAASLSYAFAVTGTYSVFAQCTDNAGNTAGGPTVTVTVTTTAPEPTPEPVPPGSTGPGSLVKLVCGADAGVSDPCKSVYYWGSDGKRHAFPNAKVYATWYADFSSVVTVDQATLSSLPLGKSVTYRPGVRMVKFSTLAKVYAVAKGGTLRWVTDEETATALYGADWTKKIDDIPDAFYVNYSFGADVASATEYAPTTETAAVATIDANL